MTNCQLGWKMTADIAESVLVPLLHCIEGLSKFYRQCLLVIRYDSCQMLTEYGWRDWVKKDNEGERE